MTLQQAEALVQEEERYEPDVLEEDEVEDEGSSIDQFDIVSSPNDFKHNHNRELY